MSWLKRLRPASAAALALAVTACGFQPLYGQKGGQDVVGQALSQVKVQQVGDRLGVLLTNRLRDSFNPEARGFTPRYLLRISLIESTGDEAIRPDTTPSRTTISISANWSLYDLQTKKQVLATSSGATTGYDVLQSNDYSNVTTQRTQEDFLISQISDDIEMRVAMALREKA